MADIEQRELLAQVIADMALATPRDDGLVSQVLVFEWREKLVAALASQAQAPEDVRAREVRAIGTAVERAAELLPELWSIRIELERGSGIVYLEDPDGQETMIDAADTFSDQINEAIEAAIAAAPAPGVR